MNKLLPPDFENDVENAVKLFWELRLDTKTNSQEGGRGAVIAGKNLDGFSQLIRKVTIYCGFPEESVIVNGKEKLAIPGYFRPTKIWDALVIFKGHLIAAFELKSQVGSFGNNFNNRSEESIGSAKDFWTAHRENAFALKNYIKENNNKSRKNHTINPPFLAYLIMLESCPASTSPVRVAEKHYRVFDKFQNSSYANRYKILCDRLILEGLYTSASLILSERTKGLAAGNYYSPSLSLSPKNMFAEFAAKLLVAKEIYG